MRIKTAEDGDLRDRWKFVWFPGRYNGYWIWLERVYIREIYLELVPFPMWCYVCLVDPETNSPI